MISSEKAEVDHVSYSGGEGPNIQKANQGCPDGQDNTYVVLTVDAGNTSSLKLANDGKTVLHPQPTEDINDPLNWPSWKKHAILFTTSWGAFTADYTAAAGSTTVVNQAAEWHQSVSKVNETNSINVLMMAVGGILWVPMTSVFGRAPTVFWSSIIALGICVGTAVVDDFHTFYALRALLGFFTTSVQTTSIAMIYDLFFFHERARKVGLWALLYIGSPLWGPLVGNFVMGGTGEWRNVCWVSVAVCGFYVCVIVAFLDETWYDRNLSTSEQPSRHSNFISRLSRLTGVWEVRNRFYYEKVDQAYKRFARTVIKPALFLVLVCYMLIFAWAIGINISAAILFATPNEFGGYGYSHYTVGYIYFAPIVAIVFGEIFGYFFNDYLVRRYTHKHHGLFQPETRLNMVYVSSIPMIGGLILLGQALAHRLSVVAVIFGWGLHNFGIMTTSVAISTYAADCYPEVAAEVSGWINFARAIGGFSVGYFQESWGRKVGYDGSFGTQAAIVAFAAMLVGVVHHYGHSWRLKSGPVC